MRFSPRLSVKLCVHVPFSLLVAYLDLAPFVCYLPDLADLRRRRSLGFCRRHPVASHRTYLDG